jgi:2-dehydro-3-deoxy-D-gluconate 5-dehydrogenase
MTERQRFSEIFDLNGKTALVTGGAMGIGEGIARRLAEAGASVMISDINAEEGERVAQTIQKDDCPVAFTQADSSKLEDIQRVTQATIDHFGGVDILVNNAGIFPSRPVLEIEPELWKRVIDLNLTGAFFHAQIAARHMVENNKRGKIVNIASIDAIHPSGNLVHYDASKAGVVMMTKSMAAELGKRGINVNAIAPGAIATPGASAGSTVTEMSEEQFQTMINAFIARIPIGHMGNPDDIAKAVLFLASSASDYITGEVLIVDGGYLLT